MHRIDEWIAPSARAQAGAAERRINGPLPPGWIGRPMTSSPFTISIRHEGVLIIGEGDAGERPVSRDVLEHGGHVGRGRLAKRRKIYVRTVKGVRYAALSVAAIVLAEGRHRMRLAAA
jgi:hypothetical protein